MGIISRSPNQELAMVAVSLCLDGAMVFCESLDPYQENANSPTLFRSRTILLSI